MYTYHRIHNHTINILHIWHRYFLRGNQFLQLLQQHPKFSPCTLKILGPPCFSKFSVIFVTILSCALQNVLIISKCNPWMCLCHGLLKHCLHHHIQICVIQAFTKDDNHVTLRSMFVQVLVLNLSQVDICELNKHGCYVSRLMVSLYHCL